MPNWATLWNILIIATQSMICWNEGQEIHISWIKFIIINYSVSLRIIHLNVNNSSRCVTVYIQSVVCDILPTFSHTETIAWHTFFDFDVTNFAFVKEGGKNMLYLIILSWFMTFKYLDIWYLEWSWMLLSSRWTWTWLRGKGLGAHTWREG